MKLMNIKQIYHIIKSKQKGELKEYVKSMTPEEVIGLRIKSPLIFKLIRLIISIKYRDVEHNLGKAVDYHHSTLSSITRYNPEMIDYINEIISTIPDWDIFKHIDNINTDDKYITLEKTSSGYYVGLEDSLQWTCYIAASIKRLSQVSNKFDTQYYVPLLKGISRCLVNTDKVKAIKRHPSTRVKYDLEPISQDMISGLLVLISEFDKENLLPEEKYILETFNSIMDYHDYFLMYPDGRTDSYDLHPNLTYNHIRCFAYMGIRMSQGKYDVSDAKILKEMVRTLLPESKPPYERSWYGLVVAVNLLDALVKLYPKNNIEINDVMSHQDFAHLAMSWLIFYNKSFPHCNPELESVLHRVYDYLGHKDGKKETSYNVLRTINKLFEYRDVNKDKLLPLPVFNQKGMVYPYPPKYVKPSDYYWQRSPYIVSKDRSQYPVFEYLTVISRIFKFIYK